MVVAVAFDSAGEAAVRDFVRPTDLAALPPVIRDIMGWEEKLWERAGTPTYPCLIDRDHVVAELYGMVNVPSSVWIDENGRMVRPPESAGSSDNFRTMDPVTFSMPADAAEDGKRRRKVYVDALRDWIENGAKSRHVVAEAELLRRTRGFSDDEALAAAHFRLGTYLHRHGKAEAAKRHLDEAVRLRPDSWNFRRQEIVLRDPALTGQFAATPEYWEALQALGDRYYYPPVEMEGMPDPVHPNQRATGG
ncbi:MAG: hypothetical protein QOD06_5 [Candidatus Binatota bacterium]|nr:hypothetical protein [Candidatus Binatota bacterium]